MATVKIHYDKCAKEMERYLIEKVGLSELTTEDGCSLNGLTQQFTAVQNMYNSKGNNSIHLIQSWHPDESKTLSSEKIHEMGIEMANRFAPGHQFVVQTHTDQPHYHNHILINPVSLETGKRIHNKLGHIETLRNINDDIARERGHHVLPPQEKLRRPGPNEHVQRINQFRGRSYIVDLVNKADFARHHATNYDEYVSLLNAFDINVRIEPKNITYFYPGREHGKRGQCLGTGLDKPGLEAKFQSNLEKVHTNPERKTTLSEMVAEYRSKEAAPTVRTKECKPAEPLVSARADGLTEPRPSELLKSLIPVEDINLAKAQNILRYCEREKIVLTTDDQGRSVLAGRSYVEVSDHQWINHKNKTRGNVIDFVANHHQTGYLNAVSILSKNPRLMLLEQQLGELRKPYHSFHIPKGEEASRAEALVHLAKFLNHSTSQPIHSELFKRQCAHVSKEGAISFYPERDHSGCVEYIPDGHGRYQPKKFGEITTPLFERKGKSDELQLFVSPKTFFGGHPNIYLSHSTQTPVLALLEPNVPLVHKAVTQQSIKRVRIICDRDEEMSENLIQFKNELKKSLELFSIDVSMSTEPSLDILKGIYERGDFDQRRSMSLGGR